jgi:hypothetical protein
MPSFPYFNFPFFPYRHYNYNTYNNNLHNHKSLNNNSNKDLQNDNFSPKVDEKSKDNMNEDGYLFNLFGLKLYFDDILLICLIFFLYNEGVKDEGLFFALILLLLT